MKQQQNETAVSCPGCDHAVNESDSVCPECGRELTQEDASTALQQWEQEFKRVRLHWVVMVMLFWVTVAVCAGLFLIHGSPYLNELVLLVAIFMVLGVYLKTKVLRLQRRRPQ